MTTVVAPLTCTIELLGSARLLAGRSQLCLPVIGVTSVGDLTAALAVACPALVGPVIEPDRRGLVTGFIFNRNGRDFLIDPHSLIQPGDRLLLIASLAGGD